MGCKITADIMGCVMLLAGLNKSSPTGTHLGVFQSAGKVDRLEMCTSAPKILWTGEESWDPCPSLTSEVLGPVMGHITRPRCWLGWELSRINSWGS